MADDTYEPGDMAQSSRLLADEKKMVLHLWPIDGQVRRVWGCVETTDDPKAPAVGSWFTKSGCTYIQLDGRWKKVCGGVMTLQISAVSGELEEIHAAKVHDASDPGGDPTGSWHKDSRLINSRLVTCTYVNHAGVWKKVCF
jgi:hypothetical protein